MYLCHLECAHMSFLTWTGHYHHYHQGSPGRPHRLLSPGAGGRRPLSRRTIVPARARYPKRSPRAGAECRQRLAGRQKSSSLKLKSRMERIVEKKGKGETREFIAQVVPWGGGVMVDVGERGGK